MRTNTTVHRFLAVLLALCLMVPSAAVTAMADGKSGKKSYKEGLKYEQLQQWDLAAQEFAMAVAAEPNNAEYKLHYARALQNASIMFVKRADELAKQGDYASAYNAYRQAVGYDQGNEMAALKMRSMLELQKEQATGGGQYTYDAKTGNLKPISNQIEIKSKPRNRDAVSDLNLSGDFKTVVRGLARQLELNVLFDESVRVQNNVQMELREVTVAKAFDLVLRLNKMTFQQVDRKTVLIYANNQQTRQNFEEAVVKSFYLGNIKMADARGVVNALLPGRPIAVIEDQKVIILKGTPSELQLVQDILDSVDKNISEVVIDVEIYEVSNDAKILIGNQITTTKAREVSEIVYDKEGKPVNVTTGYSATLQDLGGLFRGAFAIAGSTASPLVGSLFGLPPTSLSLLQSKGHSRLLNKIQIHALDGQSNNTKVGRSVPVSLGQNYGSGYGAGALPGLIGTNPTGGQNPAAGLGNGFLGGLGGGGYGGGLFNNIQYKDVGLVIEATPKITNEGYVEVKMKIETSNVESGADPLTPNFTQRSLNTVARIQDGVTSIVASVMQDSKDNSRASIPIIGMLPIIGRLFTTPNQESRQSDIVITVTPHIIRATEITKEDNLAKLAGLNVQTGQVGLLPSIEDVLFRAQLEEEQERRLVASERGLPADPSGNTAITQTPAQIAPGTAPNSVPLRNASNPGGGQQDKSLDKGLPAGPSGAASPANRKSISINGGNSGANPNWNSPSVAADTNPPVEVSPTFTPPPQPQVDPGFEQPVNPGANPGAPVTPNPNVLPNGNPNPNPVTDNRTPGEKPTELTGQIQPPAGGNEIKPAQVMSATRPPKLEQYLHEQRLLTAKERAANANKSQPVVNQSQIDYVPPTQPERVNAPLAMPKTTANSAKGKQPSASGAPSGLNEAGAPQPMRIDPPKAGSVALNLQPQQARVQVGKPVTITLQVEAQTALANAQLALRFDPTKLQVKSVRDGDMLGKQPDIMHSVDKGLLTITASATGGKASKASGRLIVIEFVALGEGTTEISLNGGETQVRLVGDVVASLNVTPTQLVINR
jgi:general secretion pathway protein D